MTVAAVVRARSRSSRLPGKTLLTAAGKTMLEHTLERVARSRLVDRVVVATTTGPEDDELAARCEALGVACFRGSADDVLDRVYRCAVEHRMEHIAHFGADNPLIDPAVCDEVIAVYLEEPGRWDYVTNNFPPTYPDGQEAEVTSFRALETAWRNADSPLQREHLLTFLWDNPERFAIRNVERRHPLAGERWTLDYPEDYELLRAVLDALYPTNPEFGLEDVVRFLDGRPELRALNAHHHRRYEWLAPDRG